MRLWIIPFIIALTACTPRDPYWQGCQVVGCAQQSCVSMTEASRQPHCEWSPTYSCYYQFGTCTKLQDGKCGWKNPDKLNACLQDPMKYVKNK